MIMGRRCTNFVVALIFLVIITAFLLHLDGRLPEPMAPPPRPKYPPGVPDKFDENGNVQRFAGNTIHSALSNTTELYGSLLVLYDRLQQSRLAHSYALLPPSSWHMTVFKGVVDSERDPWPDNLGRDATIDECTALFAQELASFDLQTPLPYRLSVAGFTAVGLGVHVVPHEADEKAIRRLRDRLADLLRIRYADHDSFELHISLGYLLRYLTEDETGELRTLLADHLRDMPKEFELGAPELARFENMLAFEPVMYLANWDA